jgi:hypothetical protein
LRYWRSTTAVLRKSAQEAESVRTLPVQGRGFELPMVGLKEKLSEAQQAVRVRFELPMVGLKECVPVATAPVSFGFRLPMVGLKSVCRMFPNLPGVRGCQA